MQIQCIRLLYFYIDLETKNISMKALAESIKIFYDEFGSIGNKFEIIPLTIQEAYDLKDSNIAMPGVYIFWHKERIIKVGRHLENSRKRALEHIRDNTHNDSFQMESLKNCTVDCGLILINCRDKEDYHWVAAIEIYMEKVLEPVIKSQRTG